MNTQNTRGNDPKHECEFSECFRIICAITWHGGGNHTHCKECGAVPVCEVEGLEQKMKRV